MKLTEVVPWGRNFREYQLMFNLSPADLEKTILGCGDGPASFNAEATALGHSITSVDPIYQFSAGQIRARVQTTYEPVISQLKENKADYVWTTFQDADDLGRSRLAAMETFLQDYETDEVKKRYQFQSLPKLDFADQQFELCLCSHFLFLYSEQLSFAFHQEAIAEMLRVAQEVRIFPLLQLNGEPSPYLDSVIEGLAQRNAIAKVQPVAYEFQKGGNQMLTLTSE